MSKELKKELKLHYDKVKANNNPNPSKQEVMELEFAETLLKPNIYEVIDYMECIEQLKKFYI